MNRRAITVMCVAVSAALIGAVVVVTIVRHGSALGALGVCGWPTASIVAGVAYLRNTRRRP